MIDFIYFGGEPLGVPVLETLLQHNLRPRAVVTSEDRKSGRGRVLTPPPTKLFAAAEGIPVLQPTSLTEPTFLEAITGAELFVVVAFNKILPAEFIALPAHQTINLHPSLLPHYRGPSPIRTPILKNDRDGIGVSVMLLDEKMDHGPLLAQEVYPINPSHWPIDGLMLDKTLATKGGTLLAKTIPAWIMGEITPCPQNHDEATYTKKLTKDMGALSIDPYNLPKGDEAEQALLLIRGLSGWPGTFFFHNGKRFKINEAHLESGKLVIDSITPEGKKPTSFSQYFT